VADALRQLLARKAVTSETLDRDRYGRIVARCSLDGVDIGG